MAATEGGARALGFAGRIAPGYKADIVLLDLGHPNSLPLNDPVNQLVDTEDGTAVASVTVDPDRLRDRVAAARERLAAANCPGLARTPYHLHRYGAG